MTQLKCTLFFWSSSIRLETRTKESNSCGNFARRTCKRLEIHAWTRAHATDCEVITRVVRARASALCLSLSPRLPLLSLSSCVLSLSSPFCLPLPSLRSSFICPSSSCTPCFIIIIIIIIISTSSLLQILIILSKIFLLYTNLDPRVQKHHAVFMQLSCHSSLHWTQKR